MKRIVSIILCIGLCLGFVSCNDNVKGEEIVNNTYIQISQEEAKHIMDTETGFVILDVREQEEYDEGHIPGAILLPYTQVDELAESMLIDKNQMILVYCRSGRRSKIAAESLAKLGYTDVREFGGIIDWVYETTVE